MPKLAKKSEPPPRPHATTLTIVPIERPSCAMVVGDVTAARRGARRLVFARSRDSASESRLSKAAAPRDPSWEGRPHRHERA